MNQLSFFKYMLFVIAGFLLSSCNGDKETISPTQQLELDQQKITDYLLENNITASEDSIYGIRYVIQTQGTGLRPTVNSTVNVDYSGTIMNEDTPFDQGDGVTFKLRNLIPAWQICLPYLKEGGSMTMYVPSGYAYGASAVGPIPANSILIFEIKLNNI